MFSCHRSFGQDGLLSSSNGFFEIRTPNIYVTDETRVLTYYYELDTFFNNIREFKACGLKLEEFCNKMDYNSHCLFFNERLRETDEIINRNIEALNSYEAIERSKRDVGSFEKSDSLNFYRSTKRVKRVTVGYCIFCRKFELFINV